MTRVRIPLEAAPEAREALRGVERYLARCGLDHALLELVKLRVSILNGCAFCVDMHWQKLKTAGEPDKRLYGLAAWREQPGYSPRERAALAWAEHLTVLAREGVPDAAFDEISAHFSQKEVADLTYAIATINAWNRVCAALSVPPAEPLPERT